MATVLPLPEIRPLDFDQRKLCIKAAEVSTVPADSKP